MSERANGKAKRFIQSALREWTYGWSYQNSGERTAALASWQHHYDWHRPHSGISGLVPMGRLDPTGNNLLTLHN
ncbi:transposase InsO family protein [Acidovorax soli]|uniref:Transposase InsO family protein n=1 Tax=Acidovorax soli TaxID=592050 RepID=A0A7X0PC71_9BURK|nr:transposase InsO family protein [Acidovorax soli]